MTDLAAFRTARGLTQAQLAKELGLKSKGYLSVIERGEEPCPLKLALQIERWSLGSVPALSLVGFEDAKLLRSHCQLSPTEATAPPQASPTSIGGRA